MSMKIYDAFYSIKPIEDIMQVLRTKRYRYLSAVKSLVVNEMIDMAVKEFDDQSFYGYSLDYLMTKSFNTLIDNFEKDLFVLNTKLVVYLYPFDGKTYIILSGSDELKSLFINEESDTLGLVEYQYWNNEDKPKNISNKEWNERYDFWERALSMSTFDDYKDNFLSYKYNENITDLIPFEDTIIRDCDKSLIKPLKSDFNRKKYLYLIDYEKTTKIVRPNFSSFDFFEFLDEVESGKHDSKINKVKLNTIKDSKKLLELGLLNEKEQG